MHDFGCMRHPILFQSDELQCLPTENSESVVGISEPQAGECSGKQNRKLQDNFLLQTWLRFLIEES